MTRESNHPSKSLRQRLSSSILLILLFPLAAMSAEQSKPLPSWNEGAARSAIIAFVGSVTDEKSDNYISPAARIATFDNDGTLWAEQPMYFQAIFAMDRVKELAADNPQWKTEEPFASVLRGDPKSALAGGEEALLKMIMATHAGVTTEEFEQEVTRWLDQARHPTTGMRYNAMVYQPMLELLTYLRANGFSTYIASGGGIEFMRPWVESVYGIPPEQVIGSSIKTQYEVRNGKPVLVRLPEINFIDDKVGKPVGINQHIGRRPVIAVGNSDGDFEMLEWSTAGEGPRLGILVHHTDAEREWAYDRDSHIGKLVRGLDEAPARGWTVVDMKKDWKVIFPE